jgi:hypothetical protein
MHHNIDRRAKRNAQGEAQCDMGKCRSQGNTNSYSRTCGIWVESGFRFSIFGHNQFLGRWIDFA